MVIPLYGGRHTARSNCAAVDSSCCMADGRLRKNNAVRIGIDVTQVYLQVTASGNSAIWRTLYSEKQLRSSGFELLHGRRTARKPNAVKTATDVTQVYLQVTASGNSAIWRTPYSEKQLRSSGFKLLHGRRTVGKPMQQIKKRDGIFFISISR